MSSKTVNQYAAHRAAAGLPPTRPPPPLVKDELERAALRLVNLGGNVLAIANEADPVAARVLRAIGRSIVSDADSLHMVARSLP